MNNATFVLVLSIVFALFCVLSNLVLWRKLRLEQLKFRQKISQAAQELQSDLELVEETELIQTKNGRELLVFRLTEDIINPRSKGSIIRSVEGDLVMQELFSNKEKSPDQKLEILKENVAKLVTSVRGEEILAKLRSKKFLWSLIMILRIISLRTRNPKMRPIKRTVEK